MPNLKTLPFVTLSLTLVALIVACVPEAGRLLQLDWTAVAGGQLWRLWSGHLVHWSSDHLFWDVWALVVLGSLCEREGRAKYLITMAAGLPAISVGLAAWCPDIAIYRGLSGIDSGLFVWLVLSQMRHSLGGSLAGLQRNASMMLWGGLLIGLVGKLVFEAVTGSCLFVPTSPDGFRPLVESHLLGVAVGTAAFAAGVCGRGEASPARLRSVGLSNLALRAGPAPHHLLG